MNRRSSTSTFTTWVKNFFKSKSYYVLYIPLSVYIFKALGAVMINLEKIALRYDLQWLNNLGLFSKDTPVAFFENFIEWFGVLYGFLLPLILVRVWEQFDEIDKEYDKEADSVKILIENLKLLHDDNRALGDKIIQSLIRYIYHVQNNYDKEVNNRNVRIDGDRILRETRELFKDLIHPKEDEKIEGSKKKKKKVKEPESLISELIEQLDTIIDVRGDRISLSNERLFDVLRTIGLVTSIMFLLPFYYIGFTPATGLMENLLIIGVTILVVLIYVILDDLDDPFGGIWRIEPDSWGRVLEDLNIEKSEDVNSSKP